MSSYAPSSGNNMVSFSVEYLSTPSRYNREGEATDTDSSVSPGTNTSGSSPNLHHALSGGDAVESPPLKTTRALPVPASSRAALRPLVSSPSDLEEDEVEGATSPTFLNDQGHSSSDDNKPPQSYIALISMAILQHPHKKMLLGDIYQFIMDKFAHYRNVTDKAWRNSIRHNLSINECFIKAGRADNGKGNYWAIHPACVEDFGKGDFRRRQARRRARRSQQVNVSKMPLTYRYSLGYVPMKSTPASGSDAASSSSAGSGRVYGAGTTMTGARSHPYAAAQGHHQGYHQGHLQGHHQGQGYGRTLETSPPGVGAYYQQYQPMSDYTNSQYYNALNNACLTLNGSQPASSAPSSMGPYSSTPAVSASSSRGMIPSLNTYNPGAAGHALQNASTSSPTMLSPTATASYLQSLSPVSTDSSSTLLELGSPSGSSAPHAYPASSSISPGAMHTQQQNGGHHPQQQSLTITSHFSAASSCLFNPQGVSPPAGYPSHHHPGGNTTSAPAYPGAYSTGSTSNGLAMCFSDMPALRDAISGLSSISN